MAVGNLLGGIAIQTVVLVALDAFGVRARRPLTFMAASLTLVLEAALVVAVLLVVLAGSQLPASLIYDRLTPGPVLIAVIWVAGLKLHRRSRQPAALGRQRGGAGGAGEARGHSRKEAELTATQHRVGTGRVVTVFGVAALLTLVAGVTIEQSGEKFFGGIGLSGVIFGSTVLAAATSLPELSTGLTAARRGDYKLGDGRHLRRQRLPARALPGGHAARVARRCCRRPRPVTST